MSWFEKNHADPIAIGYAENAEETLVFSSAFPATSACKFKPDSYRVTTTYHSKSIAGQGLSLKFAVILSKPKDVCYK